MFNRIYYTVGVWFRSVNVCVSDDADPVPRRQTNRICKATKTSGAAKVYWRRLNSMRSLPVLEWTSESEYFERFKNIRIMIYTGHDRSHNPLLRMRDRRRFGLVVK